MIIKKFSLLLFLLLVPVVLAQEQNFNNYSNLEIDISVKSEIDINYLRKTARLEFVDVDLRIFPREDDRQIIKSKDLYLNPDGEITEENNVLFSWEDLDAEKLEYEIQATVSIDNAFKIINEKVEFPLKGLDEEIEIYTDHSEFIDANNEIKDKATGVVEGETDLYMATYKLADWVKENIKYNLTSLTADALQRSTWVFKNKQGVCDELTNLFISMARSVDIPARFVAGSVYTDLNYDFANHGWAEVYFPGFGWVPFDVTFGEYGWINPSHVKLIESLDYGKSSAVYYTWRSRDVEINPSDLEILSEVKSKTGTVSDFVDIEIRPLKSEVGFGSYVPIEVFVENKNDFYVPLSLFITKAPRLLDEKKIFTVLRPREVRSYYWVASIPSDLNEKYIYTSLLEVKTNLNKLYKNEIKYSTTYDTFSLDRASRLIDDFKEIDKKEIFNDLDVVCAEDKEIYYEGESANIKCQVKNKGNINLKDIKACLFDQCKLIDLRITETEQVEFDYVVSSSENIKINVASEDFVKSKNLELKVIKIPQIEIEYLGNTNLDYRNPGNITLEISSNSMVKNPKLEINNKKLVLKDFNGIYLVNLSLNIKKIDDSLNIKLYYKDEIGKEYEFEKKQPIQVLNKPFYVKMWNAIKNFFSNF